MSVTKSIHFYCGVKNVPIKSFFGGVFMDYEFSQDIAYKDIPFCDVVNELKAYMFKHNIKIGYCDISADFGGGYSLFKRYTFVNKSGKIITKKQKYDF